MSLTRYLLAQSLLAAFVIAAGLAAAPAAFAAGSGYDGLIAPAPDETTMQHEEDTGPADLSPAPKGAATSANSVSQQQTTRPPIRDFALNAAVNGNDRNHDGIPDGLKGPQQDFSRVKHRFIDGQTSAEYFATQDADQAMSIISSKRISEEERGKQAKQFYKSLSNRAEALRVKLRISDDTYKKMGFTDQYINDEKAGNTAALEKLDKALAELKAYQ